MIRRLNGVLAMAWVLAWIMVGSTACGSEPAVLGDVPKQESPASEGISAELAHEVEALQTLLTLPQVLFFPLLLGITFVLSQVIAWAARFATSLGVRRRRLVNTVALVGRIILWLWAIGIILGRFLRVAPAVSLVALLLMTIVTMAGLSRAVENVLAGVGLALRGWIEEGDQVRIGELSGMVVRVGLTRVQLRNESGDIIDVPARQFISAAVAVGRTRNSYPIRVRLVREEPWTADEIERARRTAEVSPYRDPNMPVRVRAEGDEGQVLSVEVLVWSDRLVQESEQHLRRMLTTHVSP